MYAVIWTGHNDYKVTNDKVIFVEKLNAEGNDQVTLDASAFGTDDGIRFSAPFVGAEGFCRGIKER